MAIVKMNKISIIGLSTVKKELIQELMDLGVVEISSQDNKLTDPEWISFIEKDGDENEVINYDSKISKIAQVLESLDKYDRSKKPMFKTRTDITKSKFSEKLSKVNKIEDNVEYVLSLVSELSNISTQENKIDASITSLKPWVGYKIPFEITETKYTNIMIGVVPNIVSIDNLIKDIENKSDSCLAHVIGSDKEQYYLSVICLKYEKEEIYEILKQYGFNITSFKEFSGTAAENIINLEQQLKEIYIRKEEVEKEISKSVHYQDDIQMYYDYLIMERDKIKILSNMLKTEKTFFINGWIPEKSKEDLGNLLKEKECWYEIVEPEANEEYPILLQNNSLIEPLEAVTELYSLPSSSNIDPTASMWFFFIFFFGMMFGDVGYGMMLVIVCGLILKKFKIEGSLAKMLKTLFFAGIATTFWGVMFGSYFGDAINYISKVFFNSDFVLNPVWINPLEEPMTVLIVSFVFGLIHLFVGLGVKGYMLIRDGQYLDALYDVGFWYIFIIGPVLWLAGEAIIPGSSAIGKYLTIIGALGLILTQGREKRGIVSKLMSGVLSLYGITGYLSDVLSYSRLLALGLATGVISSVLSIIGTMGGRSVLGVILFIVVFIFGHTFNFAINALGSFVHSARLQYVEFFGKFYEGGGEPFNPLTKKTKYIKIIKEEN